MIYQNNEIMHTTTCSFSAAATGSRVNIRQKYPKFDRPVLLRLFLLLLVAGAAFSAQAQRQQRFRAGIIAGITASQIDGDLSAGYHKVGLQGGLRAIILLQEKQDASIEILFTQRGCRNEPKTPPFFNITLNYVEVPIQWHYHDWLVETGDDKDNFYRVHFNAGLSYGRLLGYAEKFDESGITVALPHLQRNSFCFLIGASLYTSKHFGFTFRYHRAFNKLYQPGKSGGNYESYLNEHFLAFQTTYLF